MFGHQDRRAIAARAMNQSSWRRLTRSLRKARRPGGITPQSRRAALLIDELNSLAGTAVCEFRPDPNPDVLTRRMWGTAAHAGIPPTDCNGIPGALRVRLATLWYPLAAGSTHAGGRA